MSRSEFTTALGLPRSRSGQGPASGDLLEAAYVELGVHRPRDGVLMSGFWQLRSRLVSNACGFEHFLTFSTLSTSGARPGLHVESPGEL